MNKQIDLNPTIQQFNSLIHFRPELSLPRRKYTGILNRLYHEPGVVIL